MASATPSMLKFLKPSGITSVVPAKVAANAEAEAQIIFPESDNSTSPTLFVSWNVNGLLWRIKNGNWEKFGSHLLEKFSDKLPDIISIQEVKFVAQAAQTAKKGDKNRRLRHRINKYECQEEIDLFERAVKLRPFDEYVPILSLADWRYSGLLVLVHKSSRPKAIRFNLDWGAVKPQIHHPEGRVMAMEFSDLLFLTTYSCNNGSTEASFERRKQWDAACIQFVLANLNALGSKASKAEEPQSKRARIDARAVDARAVDATASATATAAAAASALPWLESPPGKPLVWIGDLNCAVTDLDLSHPSFFRAQVTGKIPREKLAPEYIGQPGCCPAERKQFERYLSDGRLVDSYRFLNPEPPLDSVTGSPPVDGPYYTWRGTAGVEVADRGRYYGKGMRIDYAVSVSSERYICKNSTAAPS